VGTSDGLKERELIMLRKEERKSRLLIATQ